MCAHTGFGPESIHASTQVEPLPLLESIREGIYVSTNTLGIITSYKTTGPWVSVRKRIIFLALSLAYDFVM
jgi:hypothetical protein